jgi:WhiB family redox-sensing transcriptional regulator
MGPRMKPAETVMSHRRDWRAFGACREEDPELFFPISSKGPAAQQIAAAKAVCARCQVRGECLQFALDNRQDYGVWGGTSEEERKEMRSQRGGARRPRQVETVLPRVLSARGRPPELPDSRCAARRDTLSHRCSRWPPGAAWFPPRGIRPAARTGWQGPCPLGWRPGPLTRAQGRDRLAGWAVTARAVSRTNDRPAPAGCRARRPGLVSPKLRDLPRSNTSALVRALRDRRLSCLRRLMRNPWLSVPSRPLTCDVAAGRQSFA